MTDLVGSWVVDRVDDEPVTGPLLELSADGRLTGTTGVNRVMGPYDVVDGTLLVGPAATTMMAGSEAAMRLESRLLALLGGPLAIEAEEDGDGVRLTGADGSLHLSPA